VTDPALDALPDESALESTETLASVVAEILPAVVARLRASSLGELEVRTNAWRVRVRREVAAVTVTPTRGAGSSVALPLTAAAAIEMGVARSPAVGYFAPGRDLAIGQTVRAGDSLGVVDMLGVVQDVSAPRDGVVIRLLAEAGQAVEYGQALVDIDPAGLVDVVGALDVVAD